MKKRINITIDVEVIEEAKKKVSNMSSYLEKCLRNLIKKELNKGEGKVDDTELSRDEFLSELRKLSEWRDKK